jgi:hypothetical protein
MFYKNYNMQFKVITIHDRKIAILKQNGHGSYLCSDDLAYKLKDNVNKTINLIEGVDFELFYETGMYQEIAITIEESKFLSNSAANYKPPQI